MFENFDHSLLDDPEFKEDAVREEIITPVLARLGYSASGDFKIVRSKALQHPYIMIGTRKYPLRMIPDYVLTHDQKTLLVIDAKSPKEDIKSKEVVGQVYSYAIHPEVRSKYFAICNGRSLVLFSTKEIEPIFECTIDDFSTNWSGIEKNLSPSVLKNPALRRFAPDFGMALAKMGIADGEEVHLVPAKFNLVSRIDQKLLTASSNIDFANEPHCVSFDFPADKIYDTITCLPSDLKTAIVNALNRQPFQAALELIIEFDLTATLGPETETELETIRPLIVKSIQNSRIVPPPWPGRPTDIPPGVFRLRDYLRTE